MAKEKIIFSLITLVMDPGGRPHYGPVGTSIAHVQIEQGACACDEIQ